jgi:hypothetical protein
MKYWYLYDCVSRYLIPVVKIDKKLMVDDVGVIVTIQDVCPRPPSTSSEL